MFVPSTAEIAAVAVDGRPKEFRPEEQAGRTAVGVYVEVPQGDDTTISVDYELPKDEHGYSLEALPQPLARDATTEIKLELPSDWVVRGPGRQGDGWSYEGTFDRALSIDAGPDERTGIPALWDSMVDFWKQPLF